MPVSLDFTIPITLKVGEGLGVLLGNLEVGAGVIGNAWFILVIKCI